MAESKTPIFQNDPATSKARTPGPLGTNGDASSLETPKWFVANSPGPLGFGDYADPDSAMFKFVLSERDERWQQRFSGAPTQTHNKSVADYLKDYFSTPHETSEERIVSQKLSAAEIQAFIVEAEKRIAFIDDEQAALVDEVEKVKLDLKVYFEVGAWYLAEYHLREVLVSDVQKKFNDLRWGGKGVKVGGISTSEDGAVEISEAFRAEKSATVIRGYELHEEVHKKHFKEMGTFEAVFGSAAYVFTTGKLLGQTWAAGRKIRSEMAAHRVQITFYEDYLARLKPEKERMQSLLNLLIEKKHSARTP
jgi:hypothetical protein